MVSATNTSSESQSFDNSWELVDRDAASTVCGWSDSFSDFSTVISEVSDDNAAEGARETYLRALMNRVEPGKAASSFGDAVGTVPSLDYTTSKSSSRSATGRPMDRDECFSDSKPGSQERDPRRKAGKQDGPPSSRAGSPCARWTRANVGNSGKLKLMLAGRIVASWDRPHTAGRYLRTSIAGLECREGTKVCKKEGALVYVRDNS